MIETVAKEVPAKSVPVTRVTCDVCLKSYAEVPEPSCPAQWKNEAGEATLITVSMVQHAGGPGDPVVGGIVFDICPDCFERVIVPAIKQQGAVDRPVASISVSAEA